MALLQSPFQCHKSQVISNIRLSETHDEVLTEEKRKNYNDVLESISQPKGVRKIELDNNYSKFDRSIRRKVREWLSHLHLDISKMNMPKSKLWSNSRTIEAIRAISPLFNSIDEETLPSVFPVFTYIIALFTSRSKANDDRNALHKIIMSLLSGEQVKQYW